LAETAEMAFVIPPLAAAHLTLAAALESALRVADAQQLKQAAIALEFSSATATIGSG
jgi:hypothetical protein